MLLILDPDGIDLAKNPINNAVGQLLPSDPSGPVEGLFYYNSGTHVFRYYNGTAWQDWGVGVGDVTQASASGGAGRLKVSAGASKAIQDYVSAGGIIKVAADGAVSLAIAGTDYAAGTHTHTAANITDLAEAVQDVIGALASGGNALTMTYNDAANTWVLDVAVDNSSIEVNADALRVKAGGITDTHLAGSISNAKLLTNPLARANHTGTQLASTISDFDAAVDARMASVDVLKLIGAIDCSANPNYPAANKGDMYIVSVPGRIGGGAGPKVQAFEKILCILDGSAAGNHATVGANWVIGQTNLEEASETTMGYTRLATIAEVNNAVDGVAVSPLNLYYHKFIKTIGINIGDGTNSFYSFPSGNTYGGTYFDQIVDILVLKYGASGGQIHPKKEFNGGVDLTFSRVVALNEFTIFITGF